MEIMLLKIRLQELEASLAELSFHIEKSPLLFIAAHPGEFLTGVPAINAANLSISDLYYGEGSQDGRYTSVCLGAIAVSVEGLEKAIEVNQAKDNFHHACLTVMDNARGKGYQKLSPAGKAKRLRSILVEAGYPRLSLRQCFRHVPVLHHAPVDIRFSFSSGGRSIKKMTVEQAVALIEKKEFESEKSQIETARLRALPLDTPLAQVQDLPGYYKANVWHDSESDPQTIPSFLPILYPYDPDQPLKRQESLPEADLGKRLRRAKTRSDKKLNDAPYSETIRVYGYRKSL